MLIFILSSCAGANDWIYQLPNGYEIWHINSKEIVIKYRGENETSSEISSFIKEFSYDAQYVFTRNISSIDENNIFNESYYILDTINHKLYGPFYELIDFKNAINNLGCDLPDIWYRTSPNPNMYKPN